MKRSIASAVLVPACVFLSSLPAYAAALGDQLSCQAVSGSGFVCSSSTGSLSNGVEFRYMTGGDPSYRLFDMDFDTDRLTLSYDGGTLGFGSGTQLISLANLTSRIGAVSLLGTTNVSGFTQGNLALSDGTLSFSMANVLFDARYAKATVVIGLSDAPSGVPEPTSWAMLILGFFGIGATLRRRRGTVARPA